MKPQIGHVEITDKGVIFVYYESEKPNVLDYTLGLNSVGYLMDCEIYEASKQSIEVGNVEHKTEEIFARFPPLSRNIIDKYYINGQRIYNRQSCEAEIKDNKATIIELTKE